jgi:hypothetical protein
MNKETFYYKFDLNNHGGYESGTIYININTIHKIKKIGFNFSYNIVGDDQSTYLITCQNYNNELIGILNKFQRSSGGIIYNFSGLDNTTKIIHYIQEKQLNGLTLNYVQDIAGTTISAANILVLIEIYY